MTKLSFSWLASAYTFVIASVFANVALAEQEIDLLAAYNLARESAPQLSQAKYKVDIADARYDAARGKVFPSASIFGQWSDNRVDFDLGPASRVEEYPGRRYGVQLSQPLLNIAAGQEARRFDQLHQQTQQELSVAEADLLRSLVQAFLGVLLADSQQTQIEDELSALESQLESAQALYKNNLIPVMEVLETQTRVDTLRADAIRAKGEAAVARESLIALTGERGYEPLSVRENFSLMSRFASPEDVASLAILHSPRVGAAEAAAEAARLAVQRERGSWVPVVDLSYSYQYSDVGFDNLASPPRNTSTLAVGFNYPLFEGGAGAARLRGAWAEYYSAQSLLEAEKRDLELRARSSWLNLQASSERLLATRQAVKSAEVNVDAMQKATKAGTARPTDVLLALAQKTRARREADEAKFQFAAGWLDVELVAGGDPIALAQSLARALHGT